MNIPCSLYELYQEFKTDLSRSRFAQTVNMRSSKLWVENSEFVRMFENPKRLLLEHLNDILALPALKNVASLMMVGGCSESPIFYKAVEDAFPQKNVIIPEEAGTVVMKGAVLYGFNKKQIHSRKLPFSYGISTAVPFDKNIHPEYRLYTNGFGEERVEDVFHMFIKKGQTVVAGKSKVEYSFMQSREAEALIEVYQIPSDTLADPSYTNQPEFEKLGELQLFPRPGRQQMHVTMTFGGIDLEVEARENGTNNKVKALFDFLS